MANHFMLRQDEKEAGLGLLKKELGRKEGATY